MSPVGSLPVRPLFFWSGFQTQKGRDRPATKLRGQEPDEGTEEFPTVLVQSE